MRHLVKLTHSTSLEHTLRGLKGTGLPASEALAITARSESVLGQLAEAQHIVPFHGFYILRYLAMVYGPQILRSDLAVVAEEVARMEGDAMKLPGRHAPSLAPFANGLVHLACAEALRGLGRNGVEQAQALFGPEGTEHVAALRQAMNMTLNRQRHRVRKALGVLQRLPNPHVIEAWRALIAWGIATPPLWWVRQDLGLDGPMTSHQAQEAVEDVLGRQYFLQVQPFDTHWELDIFQLGGPPDPAQLQTLIAIVHRALSTPQQCALSPIQFLGYWDSMLGPLIAFEACEELLDRLLSQGIPIPVSELHCRPDFTQHLAVGLCELRRRMKNKPGLGQRLGERITDFAKLLAAMDQALGITTLAPMALAELQTAS